MTIEELVNQNYSRFSESDKAVWKYIAVHRTECTESTIGTLAQKCCVSRTAVMRFAQKLGFHGFAELKVHLKLDNAQPKEISQIDQVCNTYINVMQSIRQKDCTAIFTALDQAERLFILGEGMVQSSIKQEFKRIFMSAGCMVYDVPSGQEMFNLLPLLGSRDMCILISVSGENEKMVEMARQLRIRGTKLLSVTKSRDNTLAQLCDFQLYVEPSEFVETPFYWLYESTTSYFLLIDIFFLKYIAWKGAG